MNNADYIELNNNLEYWYGFIDANLLMYNRNNLSNVKLDNSTLDMYITEDETQFYFQFFERKVGSNDAVGRHRIFIGNHQYEYDFNLQLCQELTKMFKSLDVKFQIKTII